jgi:hypothetical protein
MMNRQLIGLLLIFLLFFTGCRTEGEARSILHDPDVALSSEEAIAYTYQAEIIFMNTYYSQFAQLLLTESSAERYAGDQVDMAAQGSKELIVNSAGLFFLTRDSGYIEQAFNYGVYSAPDPGGIMHIDRLSSAKSMDLPFMPRDEAEQEVFRHLSFLFDQGTLQRVESFALEHRSLMAWENDLTNDPGFFLDPGNSEFKGEWNASDDCYYMIFHVVPDDLNIPLLTERRDVNRGTVAISGVPGVSVEVYYGAEGFKYLGISSQYKLTDRSDVKTISSAEAMKNIEKKFRHIIGLPETIVKSMELRYLAVPDGYSGTDFRMIPAWCAEVEMKEGTHSSTTMVYIDAITGKEIY